MPSKIAPKSQNPHPVGRPRKNGKPHLTRELVFVASAKLIAENGFAGAGVRAIAAALDASPASLFHLFGSKDGLLNELIAFAAGPSIQFYENLKALDLPPAVAIFKGVFEEAQAVAQADRDHAALFYLPELRQPAFAPAQELRATMVAHYKRMIDAGVASGVLISQLPALAAEQAFQLTETSILAGPAAGQIDPTEQALATARFFMRGILVDPQELPDIEKAARRVDLEIIREESD